MSLIGVLPASPSEVGTRLENSFALLLLLTREEGDVGSHLEAQVVLQFGGIQVHTWLSHVGLSTLACTLACTCSDQQNGIHQSGQCSSRSTV